MENIERNEKNEHSVTAKHVINQHVPRLQAKNLPSGTRSKLILDKLINNRPACSLKLQDHVRNVPKSVQAGPSTNNTAIEEVGNG